MQRPKIQTAGAARSTKRQSALISRICSMVRERDSSSSGLATTTARHIARDTATLRRLREKRNCSKPSSYRQLATEIRSQNLRVSDELRRWARVNDLSILEHVSRLTNRGGNPALLLHQQNRETALVTQP